MEEILKIFSVIGLSSVRHTFFGVPLAASYGYSLLEVVLYSATGGVVGLITFMLLAHSFKSWYKQLFPKKAKRKFTKMNRFIVRVRQRFGLFGIALITPPILSIPVGTIIATSLYKNKPKVFFTLLTSIVFWSLLSALVARPLAAAIQTSLM